MAFSGEATWYAIVVHVLNEFLYAGASRLESEVSDFLEAVYDNNIVSRATPWPFGGGLIDVVWSSARLPERQVTRDFWNQYVTLQVAQTGMRRAMRVQVLRPGLDNIRETMRALVAELWISINQAERRTLEIPELRHPRRAFILLFGRLDTDADYVRKVAKMLRHHGWQQRAIRGYYAAMVE